jgi:hypothetical protein
MPHADEAAALFLGTRDIQAWTFAKERGMVKRKNMQKRGEYSAASL